MFDINTRTEIHALYSKNSNGFTSWIKARINTGQLVEYRDYTVIRKGHRTEYYVNQDVAEYIHIIQGVRSPIPYSPELKEYVTHDMSTSKLTVLSTYSAHSRLVDRILNHADRLNIVFDIIINPEGTEEFILSADSINTLIDNYIIKLNPGYPKQRTLPMVNQVHTPGSQLRPMVAVIGILAGILSVATLVTLAYATLILPGI